MNDPPKIVYRSTEDGTTVPIQYIDEKRIQSWLNVNRLQLPLHNFNLDSNNIITSPAENTTEKAKLSVSDSQGRELSAETNNFFRYAQTRDENGALKPYYHGTARGDRVGYRFDPERATSGPMAFFTDSEEIAGNYARDKQDTSVAYDERYDSYETQFVE